MNHTIDCLLFQPDSDEDTHLSFSCSYHDSIVYYTRLANMKNCKINVYIPVNRLVGPKLYSIFLCTFLTSTIENRDRISENNTPTETKAITMAITPTRIKSIPQNWMGERSKLSGRRDLDGPNRAANSTCDTNCCAGVAGRAASCCRMRSAATLYLQKCYHLFVNERN